MLLVGLLVSVAALVLLLNITNPTSAGSIGVLLVFANIYLVTFFASMAIVSFSRIVYAAVRMPKKNALSAEKQRAFRRKVVSVVVVLNFAPIFLISMNSIGQLNFISVVLFFAIEAVAIFYVLRRF